MNGKRRRAMIQRFKGREDLGKIGLYNAFFKPLGLDEKDVLECLDEIEFGYDVPAGILRPEDSMSKLNERVKASNPFEWFMLLGRNEFCADDLTEELQIRLIKHGTRNEWKEIETFGDLVRAWCGKRPEPSEKRAADDR